MRVLLVLAAACGSDAPQLTATARFEVTELGGRGPSPLDAFANQVIDLTIVLDDVGVSHEDSGTCKRVVLFVTEAGRIARGATADLVQTEIFDKLVGWDVDLELCDDPAQSTIVLESAVNELNLIFGCAVPMNAQVRAADNSPLVVSQTALGCTATILDVVNNRDLGARDFTITFTTGPSQLP